MIKDAIIGILGIMLVISIVYGQMQRSKMHSVQKMAEKNAIMVESLTKMAEDAAENAKRQAALARRAQNQAEREKEALLKKLLNCK